MTPLVAAALVLTFGACSDDEQPSADGASPTPPSVSPSTPESPTGPETSAPAQVDGAPLDGLTMSLQLGEPRRSDLMPSRIRVQNPTGSTVIDPGCRRFANYTAGVANPADPETFVGRSTSVMTKCGGPEPLPSGYDETQAGPLFHVKGLDPGTTYLAVINFGDARTELFTRQFTVTE